MEFRQLQLPADLCASAEAQYTPRCSSIEDLLVFLLTEITKDPGLQLDQQEQGIVEARLRDLGYV